MDLVCSLDDDVYSQLITNRRVIRYLHDYNIRVNNQNIQDYNFSNNIWIPYISTIYNIIIVHNIDKTKYVLTSINKLPEISLLYTYNVTTLPVKYTINNFNILHNLYNNMYYVYYTMYGREEIPKINKCYLITEMNMTMSYLFGDWSIYDYFLKTIITSENINKQLPELIVDITNNTIILDIANIITEYCGVRDIDFTIESCPATLSCSMDYKTYSFKRI